MNSLSAKSGLVILASMALAGCSAPALPVAPPRPTVAPGDVDHYIQQALDGRWDNLVGMYPNAVRPEVERVRVIPANEWATTQAQCLQAEGFPVTAGIDNGLLSGDVPPEQQQALAEAMYLCEAKYPTDPASSLPLTKDELGYIFDYFAVVLTPCLEHYGVDVPEAPSRETFIDTYESGRGWNPYLNVQGTSGVSWSKINAECPQSPPGFRQ